MEKFFLIMIIVGFIVFALGVVYATFTENSLRYVPAHLILAQVIISAIIMAAGFYGYDYSSLSSRVNRYADAVEDGYEVYYKGKAVDGDKLIVNRNTVNEYWIEYHDRKKR